MTTADLLYLALIAIVLLLDYFVLWPAFLRWSQANPGQARLWLWSGWMIMLWTLVAAGVALWLFEARTWESLRLVEPHGWRLWGAAAFSVVVFAAAHAYQGAKGILATGFAGCLLTLVVLIFGSLWPAIALHVLTDIGTGLVAWLALRRVQSTGDVIT